MVELTVIVDGRAVRVAEGDSAAAAIAVSGVSGFRSSVTGEPRAPLCGMGICFECRVTINGTAHQRSCMITCREGMEIVTRGA